MAIITFQGSKLRGRNVGAITVFSAAMEAFKTNKKVLVMSLRDYQDGNNLEDYALPREGGLTDESGMLNLEGYSFSDNGLDAVIRRADTDSLNEEQFDMCITPTVRTKNGLDILRSTKEAFFEKNLHTRWETIKRILEVANRIYDYVFVYIPSSNEEFVQKINEISDKNIVVVRQGNKDFISKANEPHADKTRILVSDFEDESVWSERRLKSIYNVKTMYFMPHNVRFRDAKEDGELIKFAMKNNELNKGDYNYPLFAEVEKLLNFIDNKDERTVFTFDDEIELVRKKKKKPELRVYGAPRTEQVTEKSGILGLSSTTYTKAVFDEAPKAIDRQETFEEENTESYEEDYPVENTSNGNDTEAVAVGEDLDSWLMDLDADYDDETESQAEESVSTEVEDLMLDDDIEETNKTEDNSKISPIASSYKVNESFLFEKNATVTEAPVSINNHELENEYVVEDPVAYDGSKERTNVVPYIKKPVKAAYPAKPNFEIIPALDLSDIENRINDIENTKNQYSEALNSLKAESEALLAKVSGGDMDAMPKMQGVLNKIQETTATIAELDKEKAYLDIDTSGRVAEYNNKLEEQERIIVAYNNEIKRIDDEYNEAINRYNAEVEEFNYKLQSIKEPDYPEAPVFEALDEVDNSDLDIELSHIENEKHEILSKKAVLDKESKELLAQVSSGDMDAMTKMQNVLAEVKSINEKLGDIENRVTAINAEKEGRIQYYNSEMERRTEIEREYRDKVASMKAEYERKRNEIIAKYAS